MEPRFLLDTNTIIYIRKARPASVLEAFTKLRSGESVISVVTYGELMFGVAKSPRKMEAIKHLEKIVQIIPVLPLTFSVASVYGQIRYELESAGEKIGNNDLWIAAHAVDAGLTLITNNEREFRRVRGLKIQNWAK